MGRLDYIIAVVIIALGVALELAGLTVDALVHQQDRDLAAEEGLFSFRNPGHLMIGAGLALSVAGVLVGLLGPLMRGSRIGLFSGYLPASVILVLAVVTSAYVITMEGFGPHDHVNVQALDSATAELVASLSSEEAALVNNNSHDHELGVTLQESDLVRLYEQVNAAREATAKYENIEVALRDGYTQVTQDLPLIGAHFLNADYASDGIFDPTKPEILIYAYQDGAWRFYGPSYITQLVFDYEVEPEGFAGPFDVWHWHSNWCFTIEGARVTSPDDCANGIFIERMGYQMHLLIDNPSGMFNHGHPDLKGSDAKIINVVQLLRVLQVLLETPLP